MKQEKIILTLLFAVISGVAHAGHVTGNGGDLCEDRINVVRDDIKTWIVKGGSKDLRLPKDISLDQYNSQMLNEISKAKVSCTDDKIFIGSSEKTCMNDKDENGTPYIRCNIDRFKANNSESQYVLVHHEYAGLSGFEVNHGESSAYFLSNQLSEYLVSKVDVKLGIKDPSHHDLISIPPQYYKTLYCKVSSSDGNQGYVIPEFTVSWVMDAVTDTPTSNVPALFEITNEGIILTATYSGTDIRQAKVGATGVLTVNNDGVSLPYQFKVNRDRSISSERLFNDKKATYACRPWGS